MKKLQLIMISLIISALCINTYGDWTSGSGSGQTTFTKPLAFYNAIITTSITHDKPCELCDY